MHRPADRTRGPRAAWRPPSRGPSRWARPLVGLAALVALPTAACRGREAIRGAPETAGAGAVRGAAVEPPAGEGMPRMLNPEPPFRYPPALYAQRVQANVVLRLYVDELGRVVPESTQVAEPSGYPSLDSAAVRGSESLRFAPATRDGRPVGAPMLFPVHFRHPEAAPLPGDSAAARP